LVLDEFLHAIERYSQQQVGGLGIHPKIFLIKKATCHTPRQHVPHFQSWTIKMKYRDKDGQYPNKIIFAGTIIAEV
jgi:hypothetical protein